MDNREILSKLGFMTTTDTVTRNGHTFDLGTRKMPTKLDTEVKCAVLYARYGGATEVSQEELAVDTAKFRADEFGHVYPNGDAGWYLSSR